MCNKSRPSFWISSSTIVSIWEISGTRQSNKIAIHSRHSNLRLVLSLFLFKVSAIHANFHADAGKITRLPTIDCYDFILSNDCCVTLPSCSDVSSFHFAVKLRKVDLLLYLGAPACADSPQRDGIDRVDGIWTMSSKGMKRCLLWWVFLFIIRFCFCPFSKRRQYAWSPLQLLLFALSVTLFPCNPFILIIIIIGISTKKADKGREKWRKRIKK